MNDLERIEEFIEMKKNIQFEKRSFNEFVILRMLAIKQIPLRFLELIEYPSNQEDLNNAVYYFEYILSSYNNCSIKETRNEIFKNSFLKTMDYNFIINNEKKVLLTGFVD